MDLKKEGERLGAEVYEKIRKEYSGLDYHDLITLIDNLYAGIFQRVYEETYNKKRGHEYWKGDS